MQCDADIYGSLSPISDGEIISLANYIFKSLGFKKFKIFINDRQLLFELMTFASIPQELQFQTISAIDKLDRKTEEEVGVELKTIGLSDESVKHLFHHLAESEASENIQNIMRYAKSSGVDENNLSFQARLARGLDYYTGTIFEVKIDEYKAGSVLGGGRYDKLIESLSGSNIPAVGFGLGFDRTLEAMEQFKLFPEEGKRTGALVAVFNSDLLGKSLETTQKLRGAGISVETYPDETKDLAKQLKYADKKGLKWFVVIGPEEAQKGSVILKDLETGHQEDLPLKNLVAKLKEG